MTNKQEKCFFDFLNILNQKKVLDNLIICGSWAEYVYEKSNLVKGFKQVGKTTDLDFLIENLRKPKESVDIITIAEEKGFLYSEDYITGCSKFFRDEFEVEFLICQKGNGVEKLPRTNIGVNAQQMTHMEILKKNTIHINLNQYIIKVPIPEAYVIQKMSINKKRGIKEIPDREKIDNLLNYIDINKLDGMFQKLYNRERKLVVEYVEKYCIDIGIQNEHIILL